MNKKLFVSFLSRHLVSLEVVLEKNGIKSTKFFTTFVVSVADQWFLFTAGHCIKTIEEALSHGYSLQKCRLIDYFGVDANNFKSIPFFYNRNSVFCVYQEDEFDYGLISLSHYWHEWRTNFCIPKRQ